MKENESEIKGESKDENTLNIGAIFDKLADLIEARLELARLKGINAISDIASSSIASIVFLALCFFTFLLLNIGIALFIGTVMGGAYYGFFIVAAFYSLTAIIYKLVFSKITRKAIRNFLIKKLL